MYMMYIYFYTYTLLIHIYIYIYIGDPSFAIILRYRNPDYNWIGSPEHIKCYPTNSTNIPVQKNQLGIYTPEIYGDTLDNFNKGRIGAVLKDLPWPK